MSEDPGGSLHARTAERFLALDSLRGLCAVLVTLFHFETIGAIHNAPFVAHSYMVVDFFFVLSGFVIAASYGARLGAGFPIGRFMLLRLGRLYPLHAAILMLYLAKEVAGLLSGAAISPPFTGGSAPAELVYGLLFIQIFVGTEETRWNPPTWSIAAEMWTYLVAAAMFRVAGRRILPVAAAVSLAALGAYAWTLHLEVNAHHWGAMPRCLFSFCLGVFAFHALVRWRLGRPAKPGLAVATLAEVAVALAAVGLIQGNWSVAGPFAFLAVILVFAEQAGLLSRLLLTRPMLLLGTLSYSIYMVHSFTQARLANLLLWGGGHGLLPPLVAMRGNAPVIAGSPAIADAITVAMVLLVVAVAWVTYHLIERPGQRWSRRRLLPPRAAVAEERAPTF